MADVCPRAVQPVAAGKVDVDAVVSHRFGLDGAPEAFRLHAENAPGMLKSLIFPNREDGRRQG
jgi:L-iditol 2-dehydrogenase